AQAQAEAIRDAAQQEAAQHRSAVLDAVQRDVQAAEERTRERAETAADMRIKTTKDAVTEEVLRDAAEELDRIAGGPQFPAILAALLDEILEEAPEEGTILAPPDQVQAVQDHLNKRGRAGLNVEPARYLRDGVAVQDPGRTFRITNTLSSRFDRRREAARKLVLNRLFDREH
ncbi:MAG: V-type ATP synthase subunit E, partial [Candidatus Hydrogenedentes bacterium]|nr:V-type ATP synthase subunit E [Candidatus Hydrogenedentota bacterium]